MQYSARQLSVMFVGLVARKDFRTESPSLLKGSLYRDPASSSRRSCYRDPVSSFEGSLHRLRGSLYRGVPRVLWKAALSSTRFFCRDLVSSLKAEKFLAQGSYKVLWAPLDAETQIKWEPRQTYYAPGVLPCRWRRLRRHWSRLVLANGAANDPSKFASFSSSSYTCQSFSGLVMHSMCRVEEVGVG